MVSIEEYNRRIAAVERVMDRYGVECLMLNRSGTIRYLTGASNTCSWVFLTRGGKRLALILESDYLEYRRQSILEDVRPHRPHDPMSLFQRIKQELQLKPNSLAAETEHLKEYQYGMVERLFGEALNRRVCADRLTEEARMVKTPEEIELIRKASEMALFGLEVAKENALPGISELDLHRRIYNALLDRGCEPSTFLYVASEGRSSLSHAVASRNRVERGPVVVDIHANYGGYYTDVARTYFLSDDPEPRGAYEYFQGVILSAIDRVTAGVTLPEVRRQFHRSLKLKEDWIPLTGPVIHGLGISRPELPRFAHPWEGPGYPEGYALEPNVALACSNIGLYSKKGWGVRYEDAFLVTEGKPILLS